MELVPAIIGINSSEIHEAASFRLDVRSLSRFTSLSDADLTKHYVSNVLIDTGVLTIPIIQS